MDPVILQTVWGLDSSTSPFYATTPPRDGQYGVPLWAIAAKESNAARIPLTVQRGALLNARRTTLGVAGYAWGSPADGPRGIDGIFNRRGERSNSVSVQTRSDTDLGFGYSLLGLAAGIGEHLEEVTVTDGGVTHILKIDLMAGGAIDSWTIDGIEILNRGGRLTRGMQAGAYWTDSMPLGDELVSYAPRQGGDRYTEESELAYYFGGILLSHSVDTNVGGGTLIETVTIPIDYDPDGLEIGTPGIRHAPNGGPGRPALWADVTITQRIWINYMGQIGVHRVSTTLDVPRAFQSAYVDMDLSTVLFLDADEFSEIRSYDSVSNTDTQLSNGVVSNPNYQEESRVYSMNRAVIAGDNEALPFGASTILSGRGGVAAVNAGQTLAVMVASQEPASDDLVSTSQVLGDGITGWRWMQNRATASGKDGLGTVLLSSGSFLSGRFHPFLSTRVVPKGESTVNSYVLTGSWTDVKALADSLFD